MLVYLSDSTDGLDCSRTNGDVTGERFQNYCSL